VTRLGARRWLGVDHVYITEDNSDRPIESGLTDHIASGFVTYRTESQPHALLKVFKDCFMAGRSRWDWMAFFDADELLVVRDKCVLP